MGFVIKVVLISSTIMCLLRKNGFSQAEFLRLEICLRTKSGHLPIIKGLIISLLIHIPWAVNNYVSGPDKIFTCMSFIPCLLLVPSLSPEGLSSTIDSKRYIISPCGKYRFNAVIVFATFPKQDDVMKCKHFPRYWPFVRGIDRSTWSFAVFFDLRLNKRLSNQS